MSVNNAHVDGGIFIYNGEFLLLFCKDVKLQFGENMPKELHKTVNGKLYLTTHRIIFRAEDPRSSLQSVSFPFPLLTVKLEQPILGANYIKGTLTAQPGERWVGEATYKLTFTSGGAIDFGKAMSMAANAVRRNQPLMGVFVPPDSPCVPVLPVAFMLPPAMTFGFFLPAAMFPPQAAGNTVYQTKDPPPYPGVPLVNQAQSPQDNTGMHFQPPKDEEPPPSYSEATKR